MHVYTVQPAMDKKQEEAAAAIYSVIVDCAASVQHSVSAGAPGLRRGVGQVMLSSLDRRAGSSRSSQSSQTQIGKRASIRSKRPQPADGRQEAFRTLSDVAHTIVYGIAACDVGNLVPRSGFGDEPGRGSGRAVLAVGAR